MAKKLIQISSILLLFCGFCAAKAIPIDLEDFNNTTWYLNGKATARATHVGTMSATGNMILNFNEDGIVSFGDNEEVFTTGDYYIDNDGKLAIDVHEQDIQDYLQNKIQEALDESGDSSYISNWWIDNLIASAKTKVTYREDIVTLATTLTTRARINVQVYGYDKTLHLGVSFKFTASGDHPVAEGSQNWASNWIINNAKISLKVKGVKATAPINLDLAIGNSLVPDVVSNDFEVADINNEFITENVPGNFSRVKNKIYFQINDLSYIANIAERIASDNENVDEIYIYEDSFYWQGSVVATINKGKISLSGSMKFTANIVYKGQEFDDVKGTFKLTGKGIQAPQEQ